MPRLQYRWWSELGMLGSMGRLYRAYKAYHLPQMAIFHLASAWLRRTGGKERKWSRFASLRKDAHVLSYYTAALDLAPLKLSSLRNAKQLYTY